MSGLSIQFNPDVGSRRYVSDQSAILLLDGDDSEMRSRVELGTARLGLGPVQRLDDDLVAPGDRREVKKPNRTSGAVYRYYNRA